MRRDVSFDARKMAVALESGAEKLEASHRDFEQSRVLVELCRSRVDNTSREAGQARQMTARLTDCLERLAGESR